MRKVKIGTKLLVNLLIAALLPIFFIAGLSLNTMPKLSRDFVSTASRLGQHSEQVSEAALLEQAEHYLLKITDEQSHKTDFSLLRVQSELGAMAQYISSLYARQASLPGRDLPLAYETDGKAFSSKYMLAPGLNLSWALRREVRLLSNAEYMLRPIQAANTMMSNVYLGTESGVSYHFTASNAYDENYDARKRPWYLAAVAAKGAPIWTETEIDHYGVACCTSSAAFYGAAGELLGVIATDVTLQQMQEDITGTKIGKTGYAFVAGQNGRLIAYPAFGGHKESLRFLPRADTFSGDDGLLLTSIGGEAYYLAYHRLAATGWFLAIVAEVDEITAPAKAMRTHVDTLIEESRAGMRESLVKITVQFIVIMSVAILVIVLISCLLSRTITAPLHSLLRAAKEIGGGNLGMQANTAGKDEISELGRAFNQMAEDLKTQMARLALAAAEKEKTSAELSVAARIQTSMVPSVFPAFPSRQDFDVYANMRPAKAVGGDFYDFFLLDEKHLCVCIADVSGKGVPAALFMAKAKTLIQSKLLSGVGLAQAFYEVNGLLEANNSENMFVTAFAGILDIGSGVFRYVNAGHNPPLVKRRSGYEWLNVQKSMVLGGLPKTRYAQCDTVLAKGDAVFMYTDGVTEAMDASGCLYGEERLLRCLNAAQNRALALQVEAVSQDVAAFAAGAPQADDITFLAVARHTCGKCSG